MPYKLCYWLLCCCTIACLPDAGAAGTTQGSALQHTDASLAAVVAQADLVLPAAATGGDIYIGKPEQAPPSHAAVPVVVFLHGSSGLGLKAIGEWQRWLASLGVASIAPDSFALPNRLTYTSPISKSQYEQIHAMRTAEIRATLDALRNMPWADMHKLILAGASEGGVAVARYPGAEFTAKMIYSWSCEDNYFVESAQNHFTKEQPVLNVMSSEDPYFSSKNSWLGNPQAHGNCAQALQGMSNSRILLIPGAPHTLLNLPAARDETAAFLRQLLHP